MKQTNLESKEAAVSAAADQLSLENERKKRISTLKFVLLASVGIALSIYHLPTTSEGPTSLDSNHSAFDDFYLTHVQPVLDRGLLAFNGTRIESEEKNRVGYRLRHAPESFHDDDDESTNDIREEKGGAYAKHPLILLPGFITTGLELWEGHECFKQVSLL